MPKTLGMLSATKKTIHILCDKGKVGTLRQCEAIAKPLAKHINADVNYTDVDLPFWFKYFTPHITRYWPKKLLPTLIVNEHPSLIIAAGRQAFLIAAPLAKQIPTIALLNPRCPPNYFTIVIPPLHDEVGVHANVIETLGSLHPHTEATFARDEKIDAYTVTVLLGGNSKHYTFKENDFIEIAEYLKQKIETRENTKILISPSRRTPAFGVDILKHELSDISATIWDGTGENPYFKYIGLADELLVTGDSISMISEACYLGKPVEIWKLPIKNERFLHFYGAITKNKHAVFANDAWPTTFQPLRELARVLPLIIQKI
ncbi:MAG: mitochondrial fission ELM1 family protein [Alphaproteobacteria bacterium]|nr:mitochondrial fission ELM1 family protein [Alphaproteobacteria bacterium]MDP5012237.1 mitochondrial fission ELM1 family protein [Alphaproteobacteria bacterium]